MQFYKNSLLLYAVTDRAWTGRQTLAEQVEDALQGGVTCIQLREKQLNEDDFIREAIEIRAICHRYGVPLIINDNIRVARESGADGIHVGQEDCSANEVRKLFGRDFIIGTTAKTVEQAQRAQEDGADYLGVGAVFPSPTKTNALRITNEQLKTICASVSIPAVAIGGISLENMTEIAGCGMSGIAVISAVFAAEDIRAASAELKRKVRTIL